MALPLRELKIRVSVETDVALESAATARGIPKAEVAREILQQWSDAKHLEARLNRAGLLREGLMRADEGAFGTLRDADRGDA